MNFRNVLFNLFLAALDAADQLSRLPLEEDPDDLADERPELEGGLRLLLQGIDISSPVGAAVMFSPPCYRSPRRVTGGVEMTLLGRGDHLQGDITLDGGSAGEAKIAIFVNHLGDVEVGLLAADEVGLKWAEKVLTSPNVRGNIRRIKTGDQILLEIFGR